MYTLFRQQITLKTIDTFIRCFSLGRKSHYDVLRLRRNCTDKEIKEAFIKLSKEYHPDKNKDAGAQQQFVRIVEAYNVLGKPSSRAQYDHLSEPPYRSTSHPRAREYTRYSPPNANYYSEAQQNRQQQKAQQAGAPYYGGLGINRIPNYVLIMLCFGIALVGTVLQVFVIRLAGVSSQSNRQRMGDELETLLRMSCQHLINLEMYVVQKRQAIERSQYLAEELERVKQAAEGKTNEMQTRILLEKIVGSANPTIATASLGQALATAEKE